MYSIANKPEQCIECINNNDGWFSCQGWNLNKIKSMMTIKLNISRMSSNIL
jgi:hypothetical protein